jgi:glycosyltransferase involved in cell wall biosynthesis
MKKRILFVGDGVTPTGFSTVMHNIIKNLPKRSFDVHHLGINYRGDPHDYDWKIYPAMLGGDYLGINRLREFATLKADGIFMLNDPWVLAKFLKVIKETWKDIPPIVLYFPVDSIDLDLDWFINYDIVKKVVVYTKFGYNEVKKLIPNSDVSIIPHGIDTSIFYKIFETRKEAKKLLFPKQDFKDSFIVLNANRNQPRKRIDLTIQAFSIFAKDKPKNVRLYLHMGIKDMGFDILKMCQRYGVDERLIISNTKRVNQSESIEKLNLIYNATDVGVNTAIGEGWSLTNMEHAVTGAPQIVPEHSALTEIYEDSGLLVPIFQWLTNPDTLTVSGYVHPINIAERLEELYQNKELYDELSRKSLEKWTDETASWEYIVKNQWIPLLKDAYSK